MGVGQLSESDAVDALRLPFYSSSHPTGSHGWRNQFDLGNPELYVLSCLLAGRDVASFLKEQVCDFLTTGEKNSIKPVIYDSVRTRARTLPAAAEGERIGPSPPFLFPAGLDRLLVVADPSCLASGGWSHSRTPEQVEYAWAARTQG